MRQIVIATNHDDWEALYVDGVQVASGHTVSREELLPHIVKEPCEVFLWYVEPEYSYDMGGFDDKLEDIPKDKILEVTKLC